MKLANFENILLNDLAGMLDNARLAQESLKFCYQVYRNYTVGGRPANEHMDATRALAQLEDAVRRMIEA
jgi:hypothetical protein